MAIRTVLVMTAAAFALGACEGAVVLAPYPDASHADGSTAAGDSGTAAVDASVPGDGAVSAPDVGPLPDASIRPDASIPPDASVPPDAGIRPDASVLPDAGQIPDDPFDWVKVFTVNEYISNAATQQQALQVDSQIMLRAWFKWGDARNFSADAWVIAPFQTRGSSFGGGLTVPAIYRGENGITEQQFLDYATRNPAGQLVELDGYYHGSLANQAYLDYVLSWAYKQIDAGCDNLFMDEVDGSYWDNEGYDDASMNGFRAWLLAKYRDGLGWSTTDARWQSQFEVPLSNRTVCPDGTMESFSYRAYLAHHGFTGNPTQGSNPLAEEFGQPGGHGETYVQARRDAAWDYMTSRMRSHAASRGKRVLIAANGITAKVDFQILGLWRDALDVKSGALQGQNNYTRRWRRAIERSRGLLGRDVPVAVFHDWGDGFPWQEIPVEARRQWMRTYGAEIYACGAFFAFPVHGPFGCDSGAEGTLPTIQTLSEFYNEYGTFYHGGKWLGLRSVSVDTPNIVSTLVEQTARKRRLVHLVNHNYGSGRPVAQTNVRISVPGGMPGRTYAVSPDFADERSLFPSEQQGRLSIEVPLVDAYTVVVLEYDLLVPLPGVGEVILETIPFWGRPTQSEYPIAADGTFGDLDQLSSFVHGRQHPTLRNNPVFIVDASVASRLSVRVNSVASAGARLLVTIDGVNALSQALPDRDGRGSADANEYATDYTVVLPQGPHRVGIDNDGADWLTVDSYTLTDYAR